MEQIFHNEYMLVKVDMDKKVLYWEWTPKDEEFSDEQFLAHTQQLVDYAREYDCGHAIENALQSKFIISPELQERFASEILVQADALKLAVVNPQEMIVGIANEQWYSEAGERKFEDRYFTSLEEAHKWIYQSL